jgi:murein DD-endopeptidase
MSILIAASLLGACSTAPPVGGRPAAAARSAPAPSLGDRAAYVALQQIGVPYRYGGENPSGFDCSGLVQYAYLRAGKAVPRTTSQLWHYTETVDRANMRAGDLLFFEVDGKMQHVGMYVGEGRFVHAPSSGKTVSLASLSADFYAQAFLRAGRP